MRGEYQLTVRTNKVQVKLTIRRNLTIIQGKSATGKTTLLDSLRAYENLGAQSGIIVNCAAPCRVIGGIDWEAQLGRIDNSIVFVDDTQKIVRSHAFQHAARHSSNYYVIVARDELPSSPIAWMRSMASKTPTGPQQNILSTHARTLLPTAFTETSSTMEISQKKSSKKTAMPAMSSLKSCAPKVKFAA